MRHPIVFLVFILMLIIACGKEAELKSNASLSIHEEITIKEIHEAYQNQTYSVADLTAFYLDRIEKNNRNGAKLNAVLMVNPDAMQIANELDKEIQEGKWRGALHGIPVLLKDNIDTKDKMPNTAGARIMANSFPLQDSPLAAQLRAAGAVILGKANLSEWANFHSNSSSSGWSALGGQTRNPYDLSRNPCGSSAGSGVAVSANLCVLAIGTETNGSILCPSNNNGIVGIKPTVGLISRRGIIPISFTQDTGGPMARTVTDAAIALGTLTKSDSLDSKTLLKGRVALQDYTKFLKTDGLKGKRLGYYKAAIDNYPRVKLVMDKNIAFLKEQGVTIVALDGIIKPETNGSSFQVLLYEFKDGINHYLKTLGPNATVKNLEEIIEKTFADTVEMKYHDHMLLKMAQEKGNLEEEEYLEALALMLKNSREKGIDSVLQHHELDGIIAPTGGPAWKTDLTRGDHFGLFSSSPAAIAGYPSITVPMGQIDGLPLGISFFGRAWNEGELIEMAYAFEQGTKARFTPTYQGCTE